jgi:hypothetical protein
MVDLCIIPECYVDTNLIETLVPPQNGYNHQKGCGTVSNRMKGKLADDFAVGIIDKDKKDLDYLKEFDEVIQYGKLHLFKHHSRHHYIIQISPAIERFIIDNAVLCKLSLSGYNLPEGLAELKRITKSVDSKKDLRFKKLFKDVLNGGSDEFRILANWIIYLKEYTYHVNIDELKKI